MKPEVHANDVRTLNGLDIVVIGLQPWYYEIGSNCKNIARYFALHNRVLYVNYPINRRTYYSKNKSNGVARHCKIIKSKQEVLRQVEENIWELNPAAILESINWIPITSVFKVLNFANNRKFAREINRAIKTLGFKNCVLFNDNDIINGFYLKKFLPVKHYIYYSRDFLQGFDYWKKHCTILEPQLIQKADLVVTNSTFLADYCSTYNRSSFYIGQGCNLELFNEQNVVPLEETIFDSAPIIGYVGAIDSNRLDEALIEMIAKSKKNWKIVLVGPEDTFFKKSRLHSLDNVYFLGRKPLDILPSYINAFDVCINPQLKNNITIGNYPLKVDEYLAMGKPVVATRTNAMTLFEEYTYMADTPDEYVKLIELALAENYEENKAARIRFAQSHSWENTMQKLYGYMQEHLYSV